MAARRGREMPRRLGREMRRSAGIAERQRDQPRQVRHQQLQRFLRLVLVRRLLGIEIGRLDQAERQRDRRRVDAHRHQDAPLPRRHGLGLHPLRLHREAAPHHQHGFCGAQLLVDQGRPLLARQDLAVPEHRPPLGLEHADDRPDVGQILARIADEHVCRHELPPAIRKVRAPCRLLPRICRRGNAYRRSVHQVSRSNPESGAVAGGTGNFRWLQCATHAFGRKNSGMA